MILALKSLNPLAEIVVSIIAFAIGAVWFSPLLFVKRWMAEVGMTQERAQAAGNGKARMAAAFFFTIVSTVGLAVLIAAHGTSSALKGAELGLFVGILVGARSAVNNLFELRSARYFLIVTGHDVVQFVVAGAVLGVWR